MVFIFLPIFQDDIQEDNKELVKVNTELREELAQLRYVNVLLLLVCLFVCVCVRRLVF